MNSPFPKDFKSGTLWIDSLSGGKVWRRGKKKGLYYVAHPSAPIVDRCYRQRLKRRKRGKRCFAIHREVA